MCLYCRQDWNADEESKGDKVQGEQEIGREGRCRGRKHSNVHDAEKNKETKAKGRTKGGRERFTYRYIW